LRIAQLNSRKKKWNSSLAVCQSRYIDTILLICI
jgi:hypothetical protein